jgi:hypothetical protein
MFKFFLSKFAVVLLTDFLENPKNDLTLVIFVRVGFDIIYKLLPIPTYFPKQFCESLDGIVRVHFLMENAEILVVFGWLPALFVMTAINLGLLRFILSEIKTFSWEHFATY